MSRHGARVPTTFFQRFGRDVIAFADEAAGGKLIAVLEGGYSQRALSSGAGSLSECCKFSALAVRASVSSN
jgi:histone deacetylase HOS3